MGAEDFSYVLQRVPGSMMFLGGTPPEVDLSTAAPNHSNRVFFDEDAMATGIAMYAAVALDHLTGTDEAMGERSIALERELDGAEARVAPFVTLLAGDRRRRRPHVAPRSA